jgi:hypothetical protein
VLPQYHDVEFLQPLVAEISRTKHIVILNKCNRFSYIYIQNYALAISFLNFYTKKFRNSYLLNSLR